jgi:hypothetical protein
LGRTKRLLSHCYFWLRGSGNAVAIDTLKLENESWERDQIITEPTETSITNPSS